MISIKQVGPTISDCTEPYAVHMDRKYTVREFVEEIASWKAYFGKVYVKDGAYKPSIATIGYRYGKLDGEIGKEVAERNVIAAYGNGGYTNMSYFLVVQ